MAERQDRLAEKVRNAVRDEYGSALCAWIDMGTTRCCAINVPPYKCRCAAVARAAMNAIANDLNTLKWIGADAGWENAIEAVRSVLSDARKPRVEPEAPGTEVGRG